MALVRNWVEDTPFLPYTIKKTSKQTGKKISTNVVQVVVQLNIASDSQPDEDHKIQAREEGRDSILDHYNKEGPGGVIDFTQFQIVQGPYVELKKYDAEGGNISVLYLIEVSENYLNSFPDMEPEPILSSEKTGVEVTVEKVIDLFNRLETVALAMEEYGEPYKKEKFTYNGPSSRGYFKFDFKEEAKRIRDFWETFWKFLELNGVKANDGIQIRWVDDGTRLGEPPTGPAVFNTEPPRILYVAKVPRFPSERTPSGISIYDPDKIQLTRLSKGFNIYFQGRDELLNPRTNWLVANVQLLMSEPGIAGAFERCQKAGRPTLEGGITTPLEVGKTSPNPPDSKMPLMEFVDKYVLPRPRKDFFNPNEDPDELWMKLGTGGKSVKTAAEVEEENQLKSEDVVNQIVMNRRTKASDYVGDQVFANLPDKPSKIRSIYDAYAYVLNRVDLPTLVAEALACIGADVSLDDIEEAACDAMLRQIFSDGELGKLLNFLEGKDPVYFGPEFLEVDSTLLINEMRGYLAETAKQNQGNMTGSEAIDGMLAQDFMTLSAKKLLCRAIVAGGFAAVTAIIELIRRGALPPNLSFSFGEDEQPPFKRCDSNIAKLVDNIPGKDFLLKGIKDEIERQILALLEEFVVFPVRESLQALIDSCYDQGGSSIPSTDLGSYVPTPVDAAAEQRLNSTLGSLTEGDPEKEPTIDINKFLSDVSNLLTKAQYCALLSGEAPPSVLNSVRKLIITSYPQISKGLSTSAKISSFFVSIAPTLDTSICEQLVLEEPPSLSDLCLVKGFDEGPMRRVLSELDISDDLIEKQVEYNKSRNKEKMQQLFGALLGGKSDLDMTFLIDRLKEPAIAVIKSTFKALQVTFQADMKQFLFLMNEMENSGATGSTLFGDVKIQTSVTSEGDFLYSFLKIDPETGEKLNASLKSKKMTADFFDYEFQIYKGENLVYSAADSIKIQEKYKKTDMYLSRNMGGNIQEINALQGATKKLINKYYDLETSTDEEQHVVSPWIKSHEEKINNKIRLALINVLDNGPPGSFVGDLPDRFFRFIIENDLNNYVNIATDMIEQQLGDLAQRAASGELNLESLFDIGEAPDSQKQTEGSGLLKLAIEQHSESIELSNLNEAGSTTPFVQNSLFMAPAAGLPRAFMKFDIIKNLLRMFYASAIFKVSDMFKNPIMYNYVSRSFKYKDLFKEVNLYPEPSILQNQMFKEVTEEISENYQDITGIKQINLNNIDIYDLPSYWSLSHHQKPFISPDILNPIVETATGEGGEKITLENQYYGDQCVFSGMTSLLDVEKIVFSALAEGATKETTQLAPATRDNWMEYAPEKVHRAESSTFSDARFVNFDYETGEEIDRKQPGFILERYVRVKFKRPGHLIEAPGGFDFGTKPFQDIQKFREWSTKMPVEWKGIPGTRSAFISPEDWKHNIFRHAPKEYGGIGGGVEPRLNDWFDEISFGLRLSYLLPKPGSPEFGRTPGSGFNIVFDGTHPIHGNFPPPTHDGRFVMNKMFKSFSLIELPAVAFAQSSKYSTVPSDINDPIYQDLGATVNILPIFQVEQPATFFLEDSGVNVPWTEFENTKISDLEYDSRVESQLFEALRNEDQLYFIFENLIPRHNYATLFAFFNFLAFDSAVGGGKILADVDGIDDLFANTETVFEHTFRTLYEEAGYRIGFTTMNGSEELKSDGSVKIEGVHRHQFIIDQNGNGIAINAYYPEDDTIFHYHNIVNYNIVEADNSKIGLHAHDILDQNFYEPGTYQPGSETEGTQGGPLWKVFTGDGIDLGPIIEKIEE